MPIPEIALAYEIDAAWIIALWLAIHDGHPAPELAAAEAISALAPYLRGAKYSSSFSQLQTRVAAFDS
jgi:hypothetical protein